MENDAIERISELEKAFVGIFNMVAETAKAQQALTITVEQISADVKKLSTDIVQLVTLGTSLTLSQIDTNKRLDKMELDGERNKAETEARFQRMAEVHAETDERLNIFINVLERYISEGRK